MKDKAKHTAALIQEITEELQAIEEESANEEHDSDVTRASDLEQEDTDIPLTEDEQWLMPENPNTHIGQQDNHPAIKQNEIVHTKEVIIGTEQGTTFPTKLEPLYVMLWLIQGLQRVV